MPQSCCSLPPDLLLEEDRTETTVETTQTLRLGNLAKTTQQAIGEARLGHETDAGSLKRAEGNVGEELGKRGGTEVDSGAVLAGGFVPEQRDGLLLEELVAAEFERALQEVAGEGWAGTGQEGAGALVLDDLADAADQTAVVGDGIELDAGLDAVGSGVSGIGMSSLIVD
ncbi:hypothetical protein Tdes44962_MAKER04878 [Teratosphaeria destructans]|uniref:Uncharacterized protein n=1 Tax=Teratosphaeria destructans TaxID=418781 RepID=A0A9W7VZT1_9PEZI|nr:hypothetical protein Tdes44962_MAKER04878 [Teratosphaeria destructans]